MSYWHRLEKTNTELLSDALACSKSLNENGFHSWYSSIRSILSLLEISDANHQLNSLDLNSYTLKKTTKKIILSKYNGFWAQFRLNNSNGKLRTYFSFKAHFETEQYLSNIKNFDKRRSLTKFRISAYKLKIETGRFTRPLTPVERRFCDHCLTDIEDDLHFLIQCPRYSHVRNTFFLQLFKNIVKKIYHLMISPNLTGYWQTVMMR